jgi:hypothetical protein
MDFIEVPVSGRESVNWIKVTECGLTAKLGEHGDGPLG